MSFWVFIYRVAWVLLVVLISIGVFSLFYPQYRQYRAYKVQEEELEAEIRHHRELMQSLKKKQDRFERDPEFVEHMAHEWGLAKPNETLFKFDEDSYPSATNRLRSSSP